MRWVNLEPIIQSEVCQKEKDKYHIVYRTYMEFRKMVLKNLFTGQQWRKVFPGGSEDKASACHAGDLASIPGLGRSPGEGNGNPLQCSCLENPRDGGAWWLPSMGSHRVGHD